MKSVIITGTSSGLGLSLAKAFLVLDFKVIGVSRGKTPIEDSNFIWVNGDINHFAKIKESLQGIKRVDYLINNAGYAQFGPLIDLPMDKLENQFKTNLFSHLNIIQIVLDQLKRSDDPKIINIGSMSGYLSTPLGGAYCSSKAAFNMLTDVLSMEMRPFNIRVVKVIPGVFQSNFGNRATEEIYSSLSNNYKDISNTLVKRANISQRLVSNTDKYGLILAKKIIKTKSCKTIYIGKGVLGGRIFNFLPSGLKSFILLKFYPLIRKED